MEVDNDEEDEEDMIMILAYEFDTALTLSFHYYITSVLVMRFYKNRFFSDRRVFRASAYKNTRMESHLQRKYKKGFFF